MIVVNSHFMIGSSHSVCQDYARSGVIGDIPYIIICDGCSSAKYSDVGARLLSRAIELTIIDLLDYPPVEWITSTIFQDLVLLHLRKIKDNTGFDASVFMATALVAFIYQNKLITYIRGDGACKIVLENEDGLSIITTKYSYTSGAPNYLAYELTPGYLDQYKHQFPGTFDIEYFGTVVESGVHHNPIDSIHWDVLDLSNNQLKQITLVTDGLESFREDPKATTFTPQSLSLDNLLTSVREYKNTSGEFVVRRLQKMEIENKKNGIHHYDDIAVGTMVSI